MTENVSVAISPRKNSNTTSEYCLSLHCFVKEFFHVRALLYKIHGHPSHNPMTDANFK